MSFIPDFTNKIHHLNLAETKPGTISANWLHIVNNGIGEPIRLPILVARGAHDGPVLGLTAAIHGNELNGIPVIQRLFNKIDPTKLRGTIVGVLVVNVPGLIREQRPYLDGTDLNRITPGNPKGNVSQIYVYRFIDRILSKFNYHLDLHTASFGRVNSFYVRADMELEQTARLAKLQNADIIVHNTPGDTTLRGAAEDLGIHSITIELRDPHLFQADVISDSLIGINNVIYDLGMLEGELLCPVRKTVLCDKSYWMYTDEGGILQVFPKVGSLVKAGQEIAKVTTIFGTITKKYLAPEDAVVVGRSVNPLNTTGCRIIHLGRNPREIPCVLDE